MHLAQLEGGAREDMQKKAHALLVYDLEAAVRLESWSDLDQIVGDLLKSETLPALRMVMDIILCSEAPKPLMVSILNDIVLSLLHNSQSPDLTDTAQRVRCVLRLTLPYNQNHSAISQLLDRVLTITNTKDKSGYPDDELEWLATTIFNKAVDKHCVEHGRNDWKEWAERAIALAGAIGSAEMDAEINMSRGRALQRVMREKMAGLSWTH